VSVLFEASLAGLLAARQLNSGSTAQAFAEAFGTVARPHAAEDEVQGSGPVGMRRAIGSTMIICRRPFAWLALLPTPI
jgi:hypothetical protein